MLTSAAALARRSSTLPPKLAAALDSARRCPTVFSSPVPIVDRKSRFVGHATAIGGLHDVAAVVDHLLQDRKIARATHPAIYAYRYTEGSTQHQGSDDGGEAQAGGRLVQLLETLGVDNAVVVVTRWYGGVQLGADRFRHINQAARDALSAAGLVNKGKK